eukprot:TRINITY_DN810_c0_g1_i1.p1 TRINITY_DN810_c0_g1~~TRINITY_DN810_c0_g1_i1.p1  ORF type:complete len:645 (-),score=158.26 TRINITY_DN810_c0_g1_i1:140-2014(-)
MADDAATTPAPAEEEGKKSAPSGTVPQFASLYVGDLHPDVTEAMLYEIFNSVGPVGSIRVCRDSVTRKSLGYGYVNFQSVEDAERALDTLNYSSIKGRSCRIMWSQKGVSHRKGGGGNIIVHNLDKTIDNKALFETFRLFGNILSCKVASDPTGKSYGYGFVHYDTEEAGKQAIERVNGMKIGEKQVQVAEVVKRANRAGGDVENFTNLYVKHFPKEWNEEKLLEVFSECGRVKSAAVRQDANKGREFAFVDFENADDAKKAVTTLHMKDMRTEAEIEAAVGKEDELDADGHPYGRLYVQRAQTKEERQAALRDKFGEAGVNLFVKNLSENTDDDSLRELFQPFGRVTSATCPRDDRGKCKGFGFVCFESADEATRAVTAMHLKVVNEKPLYICLAEKRAAREERLRANYGGGKGKSKGKGCSGMTTYAMAPPQPMMPPPQAMPFPPMIRPPMPLMGGKGMPPMMANPQVFAMMGKGGPMMANPQLMMGLGKGGPHMMGAQMQMLSMMGKGGMMMRPPVQMPGHQLGMASPPRAVGTQQQQGPPIPQTMDLTVAALANAPPAVQKKMIGEKLYPQVARFQPELAGKITGMMLEMDNSELLMMLESEPQLKIKVDEALRVLAPKI